MASHPLRLLRSLLTNYYQLKVLLRLQKIVLIFKNDDRILNCSVIIFCGVGFDCFKIFTH